MNAFATPAAAAKLAPDPTPAIRTAPPAAPRAERRSERRYAIERPAKLYRPLTRQYAPAITRDLSRGGAMLDVHTPRAIRVGERLELGVAFDGDALVAQERMVQAVVVRAGELGATCQRVAVRYELAHEPHPHAG